MALTTSQFHALQCLCSAAEVGPTSGYGPALVALAVSSDPELVDVLTAVDFDDSASVADAVGALRRWSLRRFYGSTDDRQEARRLQRGIDMQSIAFAAPYLPGKVDVDREAVSLQPTPDGAVAVVYVEADDLQAAFAGLATSMDPFDQWFGGIVQEVHGIDLAHGFPPPESMVDFRG